MPEQFDVYQAWIGLGFDSLIIIGIVVLWMMWRQSAKRQAEVEAMLQDAASQLGEASQTLSEALTQIQRLQDAKPNEPVKPVSRSEYNKQADTTLSEPVARMLDLHRQGASDEDIAQALAMPLAQVRLMIRLHSAGVTGR